MIEKARAAISLSRSHPLNYDERLSVAMSKEEYWRYTVNFGHTYYATLRTLVAELKPSNVLELGTSIGRSALFMMCALPETSRLVTIDIGSYRRGDLLPFENDPRLEMLYGDDVDDENISKIGSMGPYDFFFIDTLHEYNHVKKEWTAYKKFLADHAIVVMDDIKLNDGMVKFWNELPYKKIDTGDSHHFSGFGIFEYLKEK